MTLPQVRRFIAPEPNESFQEIAARALPNEETAAAVEKLKSWNLHIFAMRRPPGLLLGSDVVFVEPPLG